MSGRGLTLPWDFFLPVEQGGDPLWPRGARPLTELEALLYIAHAATRQPEGRVFTKGSVRISLAFGETPPLAVRYLQGALGWGSKDRVSRMIRSFINEGRIQVQQRTAIGDTYLIAWLVVGRPCRDGCKDAPQDADKDRDAKQDAGRDGPKDTQPATVQEDSDPSTDAIRDDDGDTAGDGSRDEHVVLHTDTPLTPRKRGGRGRKVPADDAVFEEAWAAFPIRVPRSNLGRSRRAWDQTKAAGGDPAEMLSAVVTFAAQVRAEQKERTGRFKMFETLFGPDQHWRDVLADAATAEVTTRGSVGLDTSGMEFD